MLEGPTEPGAVQRQVITWVLSFQSLRLGVWVPELQPSLQGKAVGPVSVCPSGQLALGLQLRGHPPSPSCLPSCTPVFEEAPVRWSSPSYEGGRKQSFQGDKGPARGTV